MAEPGRGRGLAFMLAMKKAAAEKNEKSGTAAIDAPASSATPASNDVPAAPSAPAAPSPPAASLPAASSQLPSSFVPGRGRASIMLSRLQAQRPGGLASNAASHVSSAPPESLTMATLPPARPVEKAPVPEPPRGAGRGLSLFKQLDTMKKLRSSGPNSVASSGSGLGEGGAECDASSVAGKLAATSISEAPTTASTLRPKNKLIREVKDTPPVMKRGETGRPVPIAANFIRLEVEAGKGVFEYDVRFSPPQDLKGNRLKLLKMHLNVIGHTRTFDGTTLYLPIELPQEVTELVSRHPSEEYDVHIKIIYRRQRRMGEVIHLYNVLFKSIQNELQMVRFGRQFYNPASAILIPQHKLQVWPGYVTAVDEMEGGLMLTLDASHRVLRTENVLQLINELAMRDKVHWRDNLTQAVIGSSVMTTYSQTLYRVDDIAYDMNPQSTFINHDGTPMTFVRYYKQAYDVDICDLEQPLLVSRRKMKKIMPDGTACKEELEVNLVPELCLLTGLSDDQRSNMRLMKDVATCTRITPNQRICAFNQFLESVNSNENCRTLLASWGLRLLSEPVQVTGRTLPPETITFGRGKVVRGAANAEWSRDATNSDVIEAVDILDWVLLHTRKDTGCAQDFVDTLKRCGPPMGIRVNAPRMVVLPSDTNSAYAQHLNSVISDSLQLVVAVCPTARDDRYAVIKKICNCSRPIPSQVINARTIMNRDKIRAIVQKIALQINCKLGGTLWSISIPFKAAMIIGIDSYHETARKNRSVCGFVASYNAACTHWFSKVVLQKPGQEVVDGLKACLCEALVFYKNVNNAFPDRVIIYRDGVGDGQLNELLEFEVKQMQSCFRTVSEDYRPSLTFIVVQKRINTRIFLQLNGRLDNPPPGTVVDHAITKRDWYDFLIVSQKVGQGTVTPSHYVVLHDTSTLTPDHVQRLTFKLCHLYYNWPGTVRVPAPCQYAHKLAFLVGQSMKEAHDPKLDDRLFFL